MALRTQSVAYLGPRASFTHQAALSAFPTGTGFKHEAFATIPAVFSAVQSGVAIYGVVPFYNTTHGAVAATLDCLTAVLGDDENVKNGPPSSVSIRREIRMPIRHFLLGRAADQDETTTSTSSFKHVDKVFSHEQALGQCTKFLDQYIPHAERIAVASTSRAAEMVATDRGATNVAAISSVMAAEEYNVPIIEGDIQDRNDNTTRFFVLRRPLDSDVENRNSLVAFTVSHSAPGALVKALMTLLKHSLNMTGIHQRPPDANRQDDVIFVEVEGQVHQDALDDLRNEVMAVKHLGSWQDS